jgi:uncharacterized protein
MVKNILYNTMLFDFYNELLTDKQSLFFELYYLNDLSLNEIAVQHKITPQAVSDLLKRTEKLLNSYESKLMLFSKYQSQQQQLSVICSQIESFTIMPNEKEIILKALNLMLS